MPGKTTKNRAARDRRQGKAATTQAGEFVREEMEHVKRGKHGAKSRKQTIAIGLSKARRAGVKLPRRGAKAGSKRGARGGKSSSRSRSTSRSRKSSSRSRSRGGSRRSSKR